MKLKTLKDLEIEETLAYKLDSELYLPVKKELAGKGITHSLGMKKENFKGTVEEELSKIKQEAIRDIKEIRDTFEDYYQLPEPSGRKIGFISQTEKTAVIDYIKWKFNITEEDLK